jgi:acyl-CoA synthetase (AMP-forming)/AMP-acid ligase II
MSVLDTYLRAAPERPFLLGEGPPVTREQVTRLVDSVSERVAERRIAAVVTCTWDAAHIVAALAACEAARVPIVLAHPTLQEEAVRDLCRTLGAPAFLNNALEWVAVSDGPDVRMGAFTVSLMTSGTTGRPKLVRHSLESLLGRISTPAGTATGCRQRWLLTYQSTTFAGLQVILTALCTGAALVQTSNRLPGEFVALARRFRVTHISGTPTFWRSFLLAAPPEDLPLEQITLGGEAVDQPTLDRLAQRFPAARITHIYASSEAGALFAVHDGRSGFPRAWLQSRAAGVGLRIRAGVLEVESPRRMLGYVGELSPNLTDDGWLVTGDLVKVDGDRVLFQGRTDDVLNVGGAKVYPQEVEEFLLSCPGVTEVRVRSAPSTMSGQVLAADVVLAHGYDPRVHRVELLRLCQSGLPSYKAPRLIRIVPEIAVRDSGKKA